MSDKFTAPSYRNQLSYKLLRIEREFEFADRHFSKFTALTAREKEIIHLLTSGNNNPEIAEQLCISRRTVEQHRKNIHRKLGINSLPQIMRFAYAFNLV